MEGDKGYLIKKEYRLTARIPLNIPFQYEILGPAKPSGIKYKSVTKNISSSGIFFENVEQIPLDTRLKIILEMPGSPKKSFETEGNVMRIERLLPSAHFGIGINFIKISDEEKEEIKNRIERMNVFTLLEKANKEKASDLHLTVNSPPMIRCYGELRPLDNEALSADEVRQIVYSIITEEQRKIFAVSKDLDFVFSPVLHLRYRVNIYQQQGNTEVVFRNIMPVIKNRKELGLPDIIDDLCQLKEGLIIIGGATGSGKTTTITTMIDTINKTRGGVILSLESPIEYLHKNIKGIVKQREVGVDVPSFASGLKASLRQDADVIVVGEVIDYATVETVLQATETGYLVISSLHCTDTIQAFNRIVTLFPLEQREFIYGRLSHSLKAVIIQRLLPHKNGNERVMATEVCMVNAAVARIIHSGNFTQLPSVIQTGAQYKMHTMQTSINRFFEQNLISAETYELHSKE